MSTYVPLAGSPKAKSYAWSLEQALAKMSTGHASNLYTALIAVGARPAAEWVCKMLGHEKQFSDWLKKQDHAKFGNMTPADIYMAEVTWANKLRNELIGAVDQPLPVVTQVPTCVWMASKPAKVFGWNRHSN